MAGEEVILIDLTLFLGIGGVVVGLFFRKKIMSYLRSLKGDKKPKIEPVKDDLNSPKTLHRCPTQKCNFLFEFPWKETSYITTPPTEKLLCPKCQTELIRLVAGVLNLKLNIVESSEVMNRYDLTVNSNALLDTAKFLQEKGFNLLTTTGSDGLLHLIIHSQKELSFDRLKRENKLIDWKKMEQV